MSKEMKVDLTVLKKLVGELETILNGADAIKKEAGPIENYVVEMAKASGLAVSASTEAYLIVGDIQNLLRSNVTQPSSQTEMLKNIFKGFGGPPDEKN